MTVRTTSKTVTFVHPFSLSGTVGEHPAGTYTVETDEELLEPSSLPAYRRIGALERDAQPAETAPQRACSKAVVSPKGARGRMEFFRQGWKHWVTLNATDLTWTALVIGGVLFTSCLMRGW